MILGLFPRLQREEFTENSGSPLGWAEESGPEAEWMVSGYPRQLHTTREQSPTEKISKGHSLHKDPMTSELLGRNEKLLPVVNL